MKNKITKEKLEKYISIAKEALEKVNGSINKNKKDLADDFLDMATRYFEDAKHFMNKGDYVTAFGALNYAHGFLDAGARAGFFNVSDSRLFASD